MSSVALAHRLVRGPVLAFLSGLALSLALGVSPPRLSAQSTGDDGYSDPRFFRPTLFRRGDGNADGSADISDAIDHLSFLFLGSRAPSCSAAADANADGELDLSDAAYLLGYLFLGTPPPPKPGPDDCADGETHGLSCDSYPPCPDDFPLIWHVLNRITFGPTPALLETIQTRAQLVRYIEEQLAAPDGYDPFVHEPELVADILDLDIGFEASGTPGRQLDRIRTYLLLGPTKSRYQLLQVLTLFWNTHFHTNIESLRQSFFAVGRRGGNSTLPTEELFEAVDLDASGAISAEEWERVRAEFPGAYLYTELVGSADGRVTLEEFLARVRVGAWKYRRANDQYGVAAEMELRELDTFQRGAFGEFGDLLRASAQSVAMLIYLNGFENTVLAPNENYSREFLELHTLGADRVYTQRDVEELAKVFTGWAVGWVEREGYEAGDLLFRGRPGARVWPMNRRHASGFADPTYWDDETYTWGFVVGAMDLNGRRLPARGHDWSRKDLFVDRYGGLDSRGQTLALSQAVRIAAREEDRSVAAVLDEFELVLERVTSFRDTAKFITSKLLQLFVTDDLDRLARERDPTPEVLEAFGRIDLDQSGDLDAEEWAAPVPLVLPNGRPPVLFTELDLDGDGLVTPPEYQEPDLLLAGIEAWQESGGNIREVLRAILLSEEFLSLRHYRAKLKTPLELVTSTLRVLDAEFTLNDLALMGTDMSSAGMELLLFADPTGESELAVDWLHTVGLLERLKFLNRGVQPERPRERRFLWDPEGIAGRWGLGVAERAADYFIQRFFAGDVPLAQRAHAIEAWETARNESARLPALVGLLLSLPEWQRQ